MEKISQLLNSWVHMLILLSIKIDEAYLLVEFL